MVDAFSLLSAQAVRERAHRLLDIGLKDELAHFRIDPDRLDAAADAVLAMMRRNYPTGEVPFHSRWRHFVTGDEDRWSAISPRLPTPPSGPSFRRPSAHEYKSMALKSVVSAKEIELRPLDSALGAQLSGKLNRCTGCSVGLH